MSNNKWVVSYKYKGEELTMEMESIDSPRESLALSKIRDKHAPNSLLPQRGRDEKDSEFYERAYGVVIGSINAQGIA